MDESRAGVEAGAEEPDFPRSRLKGSWVVVLACPYEVVRFQS